MIHTDAPSFSAARDSDLGENRMYRNDGTGSFADVTAGHLPADALSTAALALGDVDGDGDVVVGSSPCQRWVNDSAGAFADATATHLPATIGSTDDVALSDAGADGDPDLWVGIYGQQNQLLLNDGLGHYADATAGHVPVDADLTRVIEPLDVDADGDTDLIVGNRGQNRLYLNDAGGYFAEATLTHLPAVLDATNDLAAADVDDGDLDYVSGNGEGYENSAEPEVVAT